MLTLQQLDCMSHILLELRVWLHLAGFPKTYFGLALQQISMAFLSICATVCHKDVYHATAMPCPSVMAVLYSARDMVLWVRVTCYM